MKRLSRRRFLHSTASGAAGLLGASLIGCSDEGDPDEGGLVSVEGPQWNVVEAFGSRQRYSVSDREMVARDLGSGRPAVVFDAGMGATGDAWTRVLTTLRDHHVFAYDRAGLGGSEPGALPCVASRVVEELRALLAEAGVEPPHVLVGHSLGGLHMQYFARRYPQEVARLVLVDPSFADQETRFQEAVTASEYELMLGGIADFFAATSAGGRAEYESFLDSAAEVAAVPPLADIPLVELTNVDAPSIEGVAPASEDAMQTERIEGHTALAASVPRSTLIPVTGTGHDIPNGDPETVEAAIRKAVEVASGFRG